jgi:hypothetical protein
MTDRTSSQAGASGRPARGVVSLFDLRWILTILFGVYGIVVTLMGLLAHAKTHTASGQDIGINVNLWTGVPMLVVAIAFAVWAVARPTFVTSVPGGSPAGADGGAQAGAGAGAEADAGVSSEGSADGTAPQG